MCVQDRRAIIKFRLFWHLATNGRRVARWTIVQRDRPGHHSAPLALQYTSIQPNPLIDSAPPYQQSELALLIPKSKESCNKSKKANEICTLLIQIFPHVINVPPHKSSSSLQCSGFIHPRPYRTYKNGLTKDWSIRQRLPAVAGRVGRRMISSASWLQRRDEAIGIGNFSIVSTQHSYNLSIYIIQSGIGMCYI